VPVAVQADVLHRDHRLALERQLAEQHPHTPGLPRRHHVEGRPADQLAGAVAEQVPALGAAVGVDPARVDLPEPVPGALHQVAKPLLARPERGLGPLALADVGEHDDQ
jgi:hypothetical protein